MRGVKRHREERSLFRRKLERQVFTHAKAARDERLGRGGHRRFEFRVSPFVAFALQRQASGLNRRPEANWIVGDVHEGSSIETGSVRSATARRSVSPRPLSEEIVIAPGASAMPGRRSSVSALPVATP